MYQSKLLYSAFLLQLLGRAGDRRNWSVVDDLCDRFERVMASISTNPIVWDGDYA